MAKIKSLKDFIFTCIIYGILGKLLLYQIFAPDGGLRMNSPILSMVFLIICLKLSKYWFPVVSKIFRLIKKLLLFCWGRETKTTGAKRGKAKTHYNKRKH